jgi:Right handed beta helix region
MPRINPITFQAAARPVLRLWIIALAAWLFVGSVQAAECNRCGWAPPKSKHHVGVKDVAELRAAVGRAQPGWTILLRDGIYQLDQPLFIHVPDLVIRGLSGNRSKVVIRGSGMTEGRVGVALSVDAPRVVLADFSVGWTGFHAIQIRGEAAASDAVIHNVLLADTGQQLLKGSTDFKGKTADRGLVACSVFKYTDHAPSDYTNGVDVLNAKNWVVRDNYFYQIRGPREGYVCGPAILMWNGAQNSLIERNLILDCYRGITIGLVEQKKPKPEDQREGIAHDHEGGIVRNNLVVNRNAWADEGISANDCPDVRIEHNTVLVSGYVKWSIAARFSATNALVRNNLTNFPIISRDGGKLEQAGNVISAQSDWFTDPVRGVLRLARSDLPAIDAGVAIEGFPTDFDRKPRVSGKAPDAGAFEFELSPGKP